MRFLSLFSGIEAASVAWEPLGWECMAVSEIDPFACAVLQHRYPDVPNLGDVCKVDWRKFVKENGTPDVVVGGSPCQSFSIAGLREGLSGESGLMWEYVRAVRSVLPRWVVWENVKGALNSSGGADFRCLLQALDDCGYGLAWRVLDAQFFGVPQRRERVFLVGYLGDPEPAAQVLFERESMSWHFSANRTLRQELTAADGASPGRASAVRMRAGNPANPGGRGALISDELSLTIATNNDQTIFCMSDDQGKAAINQELAPTLAARADKGGHGRLYHQAIDAR